MGPYIRKAFSIGPLRLNLSGSGLGVSFGVRGARIGIGPKGSYYHVGRNGLYYRGSLRGRPEKLAITPVGTLVETSEASQLTDASSDEFIRELERVRAYRSALWPTLYLVLFLYCAFLFSIALSAGTAPMEALIAALVCTLAGIGALVWARQRDLSRGRVVINYDVEAESGGPFHGLVEAMRELSLSEAIWSIDQVEIGKRRDSVRRLPVRLYPSLPRRVVANLNAPTLNAGRQTLYFCPERILVYDRNGVGSVPYGELAVETTTVRFVETSPNPPMDAEQVGVAWEHETKDGNPDLRFRVNSPCPVLLYGVLHLKSASGLNELFYFSKCEALAAVKASLIAMSVRSRATSDGLQPRPT